jgi:hypothetical protein
MKELTLTPDLSVSVEWSSRMQELWRKHYPDLWFGRPCADEQSCQEYNLWQQRLEASCQHIQRFFRLTGNLPIAGDLLQVERMEESSWKRSDLFIDARRIFTYSSTDRGVVIYEVHSRFIDLLEVQEGRMEAKEGWF